MPRYLCLQRNLPSDEAESPSPAQMQEMYARFAAWREKFADNIVDMGGKLGDGKLVRGEGVIDGPFVEVKEIAGGYMILSADDLEEAMAIAGDFPGLVRPGSGVEVIEIKTP